MEAAVCPSLSLLLNTETEIRLLFDWRQEKKKHNAPSAGLQEVEPMDTDVDEGKHKCI